MRDGINGFKSEILKSLIAKEMVLWMLYLEDIVQSAADIVPMPN